MHGTMNMKLIKYIIQSSTTRCQHSEHIRNKW